MNKKAEMGIGTLILFIAMILVAAVAAGVLIQTASSLQSRALLTGSRATSEVSTALQITYVSGTEASASHNQLNLTFANVKLVPGSDPLRFNDLVVNLDTESERQAYTYNSTNGCGNATSDLGDDEFGIRYLTGGSTPGFLIRGDIAEICMKNPEDLTQGADMRIIMTPKAGQQAVVDVRAPDVMVENTIQLYP